MVCRVVCGRAEVIATLVPTSALVSVDLPVFGLPTKHTKPEWNSVMIACRRTCTRRHSRVPASAASSWSAVMIGLLTIGRSVGILGSRGAEQHGADPYPSAMIGAAFGV